MAAYTGEGSVIVNLKMSGVENIRRYSLTYQSTRFLREKMRAWDSLRASGGMRYGEL